MIVNEFAGSGGDAMPWYFKRSGLGKLAGKRTWGGLVGRAGTPALMDGGMVTAPASGIWNPNGQWEVENQGITPDIEVEHDPELVRQGPRSATRASGRGGYGGAKAAGARPEAPGLSELSQESTAIAFNFICSG